MNNQLTERTDRDAVVSLYGALAEDDFEAVAAMLHDDVILHVPGSHPLAGEHRGPQGLVDFMMGTRERTENGESLEVVDVLQGADHVAVLATVRATRAGRTPLDNRTVHLLRLDAGRVTEIWLHNFDDLRVNEFWS